MSIRGRAATIGGLLTFFVACGGMAIAQAPAEAPSEPAAPPAATPSAPSLDAALDEEIARARAALERMTTFEEGLVERTRRENQATEQARTRIAELDARTRLAVRTGTVADELYDDIVTQLEARRGDLRGALDELNSRQDTPEFEARLDLHALDLPALADRVAELRELYGRIATVRDALRTTEERRRWNRVEALGELVAQLNDIRITAMAGLSASRRAELLGLTPDGVAQVRREIEQLTLAARTWLQTRIHSLARAPERLSDVFAVGSFGLTILKLLLTLIVYLFARSRIGSWLDGFRKVVGRLAGGARRRRQVEGAVRGVRVLAPWGLFLLFVLALRRAFGAAAAWPEVDLPLRLAALYGGYRLVIDAAYGAVLAIARRYRLRMDDERTRRLQATVRTLTRFGFGLAVLLTLAAQFLGRGALYHVVLRLAWVLLFVTLFRLVRRWRVVIADTYLRQERGGTLTRMVQRTRERWYGVFVAAAALGLIAARGLAVMARDFALGFDQTRRALAFVFRRKMEKQAAIQGYAEGDVDALPDEVRRAFTEDLVDGSLEIDHFPGIDRFEETLARWNDDGTGGNFLLTGQYGSGKSSWLARARATAAGERWTAVQLDDRLRSPKRLAATLAEELGIEGVEGDLRQLQTRLVEGEQRCISLDRCQNLFLGEVGGFRTFEAFVNLMEATCRQVFWLCAMDGYAWSHLVAARPDLNVYRRHEALTRWSEEQIRELIRVRTAACGLQVTYEDLFADRLDRIDARARSEETDRGYTRLLWDYSDGNPRAALHFWLRSLVSDGEHRARVRLFRSPDSAELEALGEQAMFLLASLASHENLTMHEAADVTRYPVPLCRIRFERLRDLGVLSIHDDRARISTHWQRAVLRTLRRRNLLSD